MFIGRKSELGQLKTCFSAKRSTITVIYGRRRIGKSSLIAQAAKGFRFFSFEGLENQSNSAQKKIIIEQLKGYGVSLSLSKAASWYEILSHLSDLIDPHETTIILLDELQWLAHYRSELVSNIKIIWDSILAKHQNLKLVLCGSVASFMVKKVIRSKALYGRCDISIHLQPFKLHETRELLGAKSIEEVTLAHLLVGGVPKYLDLLTDKSSVVLSLAFHCQGLNTYFAGEYERIFVSHFGKDSQYDKIVRYLNSRLYGASRAEISTELRLPNSGMLTEALNNLEYAGIIQSVVPFHKKINTQKRFLLVDHYIRFYLTFLEPLKLKGELARLDFVNQVFNTPKMSSWLGLSFELLCLQHHAEIAIALGFAAVRYQVGPYYQVSSKYNSRGFQLDLVYKRSDKVFTVCEVKYQVNVGSLNVAKKLDQAIQEAPELRNKTIQKVLINAASTKTDLADGIHFSRVLSPEDLCQVASWGNTHGPAF